MKKLNTLSPEDMKAFEPEAKIGLIATVNGEGLPHVTLISSVRAKSKRKLMFGQFSEGLSKVHVKDNPKLGFLVLTMDKKLWRGRAQWTHAENQGEDYDLYNNLPMFRYNAYFGIHTVHYLDLVETHGREKLPLPAIMAASVLTSAARTGNAPPETRRVIKPWAEVLFNQLSSLKFLSYVDSKGYPVMIPLFQCQALDGCSLVFSPLAYGKELSGLAEGQAVAVYGATLKMENILVRGTFAGFRRRRNIKLGRIDLNWVYNSMPPQQGQIYPETELKPVVDFS